jgi:MIP family channel proteins
MATVTEPASESSGSSENSEPEAGLFGSEIGANMPRAAAAEAVGTFILVFAGTSVAVAAALGRATAGAAYGSLAVALAFGIALLIIASALGHISGAHVNPAVTIGLAAGRRFPWRFVPTYVIAQLAGGCLGALATWAVFGDAARTKAHLAATYPAAGVGDGRALLVEALVTIVLVLVVVAVATDERVSPATTSIGVGFALAVAVFIAGPLSGGAANPARALGPMIVAGKLTAFWIYLVGPLVGGAIASLLYNVISIARPPD